ncbi:MAG: oligosaccharide flippase family protein [Pseudomonadota bacterium]
MSEHSDPRDAYFDVTGLTEDLGRRTGRSSAAVVFSALLKLMIALVTTAILARLVPPELHGLVATAVPFVLIAVGLSEFGLAQAITQMPHVTHRLASTLFWVNVALGLTLTLLIIAIAPVAGDLLGQAQSSVIFIVLSPYIFLSVLNTQYIALLRRKMRIVVIERCVLIATVLASLMAIIVAWMGYGIAALIVQLLAQQGLTFVGLALVTGWVPSRPHRAGLAQARGALAFGGFLAAERLLNDATRAFQIGVIARSFGAFDTGLFYRTETFALMPQRRLVSPLSAAFIPSLSRLQDDADGFRKMLMHQVSRGNVILVPVGAFFCTCPDLVVAVLLGEAWMGAVPILRWLGVNVLFGLTLSCFAWALVAAGRSRDLFTFRLCSAALIVVAILAFAPYGLLPMVQAYVVAAGIISVPLLALFVVRATPVTRADVVRSLGQTLGLSLALIGTGWALRALFSASMAWEGLIVSAAFVCLIGGRVLFDPILMRDLRATLTRE